MTTSLSRPAQLAKTLRQEILTGRLVPGQKLMSIQDLSQMYQVSVRTVREALALLEQSGYLQCQSRRRAVILSGPTPQTAQLIEETLRQRDQFSDGYRTIRRLLPLLLWQSRLMMDKNEFDDFFRYNQKMIRWKGDNSWLLSAALFHGLLNYSGNSLFLDLYRGLEQQCLIPVSPGMQHPYEVLARNPQSRDFSLLLQGLQDHNVSFLQERIDRMIENIQQAVCHYIQVLSAAVSQIPEPVFHFHWQTGSAFHTQAKSRQIAQALILDILSGKLQPNTFLPSEKVMASQWNVSADTLRRSLHYLRQTSPTMEAILRQVLQLIYAGSPYLYHARKLPGGSVTPDAGYLLHQTLDALKQNQIPAYAQSIYQCFLLLFRESRTFLIQAGVSEAKRLQLPDTLPLTLFCETNPKLREFPNSPSDAKIR